MGAESGRRGRERGVFKNILCIFKNNVYICSPIRIQIFIQQKHYNYDKIRTIHGNGSPLWCSQLSSAARRSRQG